MARFLAGAAACFLLLTGAFLLWQSRAQQGSTLPQAPPPRATSPAMRMPGRLEAPEPLAGMYRSEGHMGLVTAGCSHLTATPKITIDGDDAQAVGYSFVVVREGERWILWRAAINHWTLKRAPEGWRIVERFNRTLNGSEESHETMRKVAAI